MSTEFSSNTHMYRLLAVLRDQQEVVAHQNRYYGPHFRATRVTTQGGLLLPTLFNFIVGIVLQKWLALTVGDQLVLQEVLVLAVGRFLVILYADDDMAGSEDLEWIKGTLNVLIDLLGR